MPAVCQRRIRLLYQPLIENNESPRLPRPVVDAPFQFHTVGLISINTLVWE
jgi:hypothetical protein